jgi:hypothetical protein
MSDTDSIPIVAPTSVAEDLLALDQIFDNAKAQRLAIVEKLAKVVETLVLDPAKPRETEVAMQIVNGLNAVLTSTEAAAGRRLTAKMKKQEVDLGSRHAAAVAELLSRVSGNIRIGTGTRAIDGETEAARLEQACNERNLAEVTADELRTDPKDID